ncbi:FecR domain-containing protein [Chitinophaga sp. CF118]|uniref:FecR domain-containing protein n=1 Tax=Chitinophaga sp. CF118 TaxID=1884367 RepID=UPI0015A71FDC|nr:FecR domain-containing protein [Chitinophaga sp. CF118]
MSQSTEHYEKLLQKYLDGQCSITETEELYAWLQSSPAHRSLLSTMQREFEQAMNTRHEIPAEVSDRIENRLLEEITQHKVVRLHYWRWTAAAAIVLLLAGVYFIRTSSLRQTFPIVAVSNSDGDVAPGTNKAILTLSNGETVTLDSTGNRIITQGKTLVHQRNGQLQYAVQNNEDAIIYNTLTVPRGGQFNIVLPDGSHVWLNAASSLKYPTAFNGAQRMVEMQGQGYFEVAKNTKQPFFVKVNNMEVQVLGTSFDVMAYTDEKSVNTTLLEGAIKVQHGNNQQRLQPGQQAVLDPATGAITVRRPDVDQVIAWKTGFFEFDNAPLADIMRQLSRWYDIDVNYTQVQDSRLFGGRISRNLPLSDILHMLEANGPKFLLTGRKLIVK